MKEIKKNGMTISLITTVFCSLCFIASLNAQTNFWKSKDAYLGQTPPNDEPAIFGKEILADSGIVLGRVTFSNDGKAFYYSYAQHWFDNNGNGTKEIVFDGEKWQKPKVIAKNITNPALSADGKTLYLGDGGETVLGNM